MYTRLIWTLKACWTIYYSRITYVVEVRNILLNIKMLTPERSDGVQKMDIRIKVAWLLNGATYIATFSMILFKCRPLRRQWQINPDPGGK